MTSQPYHRPVLASEVVSLFQPVPDGIVVDATFGGGGHTRALSDNLGERVRMIGIDRDPDARANAGDVTVLAGNFGDLDRLLDDAGVDSISGALFDLGISSHQVDQASRGFSYREDGPLDMRMDPTRGRSAADLVNTASENDLVRILRTYGEERFASGIARQIVRHRPFTRTLELAEVIAEAVPAAVRRKGHPARQAFQAFRIEVNGELDALRSGLEAALSRTVVGGRCAVISYHSLEDRIVKQRFADLTTPSEIPHPDLPVRHVAADTSWRPVTRKAIKPGASEVAENPRARSARLRCIERVAA